MCFSRVCSNWKLLISTDSMIMKHVQCMWDFRSLIAQLFKSIKVFAFGVFIFSKDLAKFVCIFCGKRRCSQLNYASSISRKGRNMRKFQILCSISDFFCIIFMFHRKNVLWKAYYSLSELKFHSGFWYSCNKTSAKSSARFMCCSSQ